MSQSTPHNLLPLVAAFTGRDQDVSRLKGVILKQRITCLAGPAGVGKTELARAVAHQLRTEGSFPDGIYHFSLEGGSATTFSGNLCFYLGVDVRHPFRDIFGEHRILIIWDQMEDMIAHQSADLQRFLDTHFAEVPNIHHLLISRTPLPGYPAETLETMDRDACFAAFCNHLPDTVSLRPEPGDAALVKALALLDGNPLAIRLAALWCRPPRWVEQLEQVLRETPAEPGPLPAGLSRMLQIAHADLDREAMRLLSIIQAFPGGASAQALGATFGGEWSRQEERLRVTGMIEAVGHRRHAPPAVRQYVVRHLGPLHSERFQEQAAIYLQQMARECRTQFDRGNADQAMTYLRQEWENLRANFSWAVARMDKGGIDMEEDSELVLDYCLAAQPLLFKKGMFVEGIRWMESGARAGHMGERPFERAVVIDHLGLFCKEAGDAERAGKHFEEALDIFRTMPDSRIGAGAAAYHLGLLRYEQGDLAAARAYFEEALPLLRQSQNRAFAGQVAAYLGMIALDQNNPEQALPVLEEATALFDEATLAPEMRVVTLMNLARTTLELGQKDACLDYLSQAMSVAFLTHPRLVVMTAPQLLKMAGVFFRRDDHDLTLAFMERLSILVGRFKGLTPRPEVAGEWQMASYFIDRVAQLITLLGAALGALEVEEAKRGEARVQLPKLAEELDRLTRNTMGIGAWIGKLLEKAGPG